MSSLTKFYEFPTLVADPRGDKMGLNYPPIEGSHSFLITDVQGYQSAFMVHDDELMPGTQIRLKGGSTHFLNIPYPCFRRLFGHIITDAILITLDEMNDLADRKDAQAATKQLQAPTQ